MRALFEIKVICTPQRLSKKRKHLAQKSLCLRTGALQGGRWRFIYMPCLNSRSDVAVLEIKRVGTVAVRARELDTLPPIASNNLPIDIHIRRKVRTRLGACEREMHDKNSLVSN